MLGCLHYSVKDRTHTHTHTHEYIMICFIYFILYGLHTYFDESKVSSAGQTHAMYVLLYTGYRLTRQTIFFLPPKISSDLPCRPVIDNTIIATTAPCLLPVWQSSHPLAPRPRARAHTRTPVHPPPPARSNDVSTCRRTSWTSVNGKPPK